YNNKYMTKENCFELGYVSRTHGLKGDIVLYMDVENLDYYADIKALLIDVQGNLVPFFIKKLYFTDGKEAIVSLEEVNSKDEALRFKGKTVFLPDAELPPLEEDEYYLHELLGYEVEDKINGKLGKVQHLYNAPQSDMVAVIYQKAEVLLPLQFMTKIDKANKLLYFDLPEGLIEVYLEAAQEKNQ
ncbi:MAG: 16S rRNA processing protein RimM, partial [Bernardetiaceae bacterium]|nr:16S rRNA processing protein RimM [Bernardetiaceae bacterium]